MKRSVMLVTILFFFFAIRPGSIYSQNKLVIATAGPAHPMYFVALKLLPEAFKKLDYNIEFKDCPPLRADSKFDTYQVDGFIFADAGYAKKHPNSVIVKTPIGYDNLVVFTKSVNFKPNGWASLKPYSIGYMLGYVVVENNTRGMNIDGVQNPDQVFSKLRAGRNDIAVLPQFLSIMYKSKYPEIKYLLPPLERVALYTFLTDEHVDLASKLASVLSDLRASGRIKIITDQVVENMQK